MNFKLLLKLADDYEAALETSRSPNIPYARKRVPSEVKVVDADGLSRQDYNQIDPAREQTLINLKQLQKLTTQAMKLIVEGRPSVDIVAYILYIQKYSMHAEHNAKMIGK